MNSASELFLAHSVRKLEQMTGAITLCLGKLTDQQIWRRDHPNENTVGNLVLHLCGNVQQWIGSSLAGDPDIRNRPAEFSFANLTRDQLQQRLSDTMSHAIDVLKRFPPDRITETVTTQNGPSTALETIYQVVGHFQQHAGQIIFATKQMTAEDLQIYRP